MSDSWARPYRPVVDAVIAAKMDAIASDKCRATVTYGTADLSQFKDKVNDCSWVNIPQPGDAYPAAPQSVGERMVSATPESAYLNEDVVKMIDAAVAERTEQCAKVAEDTFDPKHCPNCHETIAAAIRAMK